MFQPWDPAGDFPLFAWPHQLGLGWDWGPRLWCSDVSLFVGGRCCEANVNSDQLQGIAFKVGGLALTGVTGLDSGLKIFAEPLNCEDERTMK